MSYERVLLTSYFCRVPDPQRGRRVPADNDALVTGWIRSIDGLGLVGVIFHDGLSDAFVARHRSAGVSFVRARVTRGVSCNDERFFVYRKWLTAHPATRSVFLTDLFDLRVCRDPHAVIDATEKLWVGCEPWTIAERPTMLARIERAYGAVPDALRNQVILNAGILGAERSRMMSFLDAYCEEMRHLRSQSARGYNCNMAALNMLLRSEPWVARVHAPGRPLHSTFQNHEPDDPQVCFIHR